MLYHLCIPGWPLPLNTPLSQPSECWNYSSNNNYSIVSILYWSLEKPGNFKIAILKGN